MKRSRTWSSNGIGMLAWVGAMSCLTLAAEAQSTKPSGRPLESPEARVQRILKEAPLVDGHNDAFGVLHELTQNRLDRVDFGKDTRTLKEPMQTDIPRLRQGMVGGQFWSIFISPDHQGAEAIKLLVEEIDFTLRVIARYPESFELATTAADVERIHKSGKVACLLGIEGAYSLGNSLAALRLAHLAGVRYVTLTHWRTTDWADAATDKPRHGGLTRFGREMVREMNRLGVMVDLSHVSDAVMRQAMEESQAPVIFSHSSARALCHHPRNVPDDILGLVTEKRGIVMVNFAPGFISEQTRLAEAPAEAEWERLQKLYPKDPEKIKQSMDTWRTEHPEPPATLSQVADHIEHIRRVAGVDHVGIGSDFDGIGHAPDGLEDVSRYPALLAELARRGWSDADLKKLAGGNILRVMRAVDEVGERLRRERPASDATIEEMDSPPPSPEHPGPSAK